MASLTAISWRRAAELACQHQVGDVEQAMSRTMATTTRSAALARSMGDSDDPLLPKKTSRIEPTSAVRPSFAESPRARSAAMAVRFACAVARDTPGFRRPTPVKYGFAAIGEGGAHLIRQHAFRHRGRYPQIRPEDRVHTDEPGRRDSNDGQDDSVDAQRSADDVRRAAEQSLPGSVVQNRDGTGAGNRVFVEGEKRPRAGTRPKVEK